MFRFIPKVHLQRLAKRYTATTPTEPPTDTPKDTPIEESSQPIDLASEKDKKIANLQVKIITKGFISTIFSRL